MTANVESRSSGSRAILRVTALLGSSTVVSVLAAIATSKFYAIHIDADGIGLNALLQSVLAFGGVIAALGIPTGLTRAVAVAGQNGEVDQQVSALVAARRITFAMSVLVFGALLLVPRLADAALGVGRAQHWEVAVLALAGVVSVWTAVQTAYLNGHQKLGELARLGVVSSVASATAAIGFVALLGIRGVAPAVLASAVVAAALSRLSIARAKLPVSGSVTQVGAQQRSLLRFGVPMMVSGLLGGGVQMLLPVLVLRLLDRDSVGVYRAASAISVNYLGLLVTAMAQDYYPRASAAPAEEVPRLLDNQHRILMLLALPIVVVGAFVSPIIVPILYKAGRLTAAVPVLQWQLIGDLLRLSSWTMAYVVLARSGSIAYFVMEALGGIGFLSTSWIGMKLFGVTGTGIGFLAGYAVYWVISAAVLKKTQGVTLSAWNALVVIGAVTGLVLVQLACAHLSTLAVGLLRGGVASVVVLVAAVKLRHELWPRLRAATSRSAVVPGSPRT